MIEQRITARARTFLPARAEGWSALAEEMCFVTNLSPAGACVQFPNTVKVPRQFDLILGQDGQAQTVETIWRQADKVGVRFLTDRPKAPEVLIDD